MKIPEEPRERMDFVREVIDICQGSKDERQSAYRTLKQYYLYGQETGTAVDSNIFGTINKIYPHIDKICSILYSPDSTRFGIEIGHSVSKAELKKVPALTGGLQDEWQGSETDTRVGEALKWSLVYGSMFLKPRPKGGHITTDIVEPHHVGVYREDLMGLENQEAFYQEYRITKSQLIHDLTVAGHKEVDQIVAHAIENANDMEDQVTQPVDRIVTSSALPMAQGEINTYIGSRISYVPKLKQPLVRMYELYVWDDKIDDYRVFTCAHPWLPIYDRPIAKMYLPEERPLVQICPFPTYGYFWGIAACERFLTLQMIRNTRWDQVQHIMELQASPPSFGSGEFMAPGDEIQAALDSANGLVLGASPGTDMKKLQPQMPDDLFAEVNYIDGQFDDAVGVTDQMAGKGEAGVRSEGHATQLMRAGSSRAKNRALLIERQIEELATLMVKILMKYSDKTFKTDDGIEFLANQFTDDFVARVDSHSSSPIFMQDMTNLAFSLFKAKAITREKLIDMLPLSMKDLLKIDLKTKIEPAEQRAAAEQKQIELATGKVSKIGAKKS